MAEQVRLSEQFLEQANFAEATMVDHEMELQLLREEARREGFADDDDVASEEGFDDEEGEEEEEQQLEQEATQMTSTSTYWEKAAASMARASAAKAAALAMIQGSSTAPRPDSNSAQEAVGLTGSAAWPSSPAGHEPKQQIPSANGTTNPENSPEPPIWV